MRQSDFNPGYVMQFHELDPAVLRAQRMQELKDLAEWRHRRVKQIQEWSDPVKRAAMKDAVDRELIQAQKLWAEQLEADCKPLGIKPFAERITMRAIVKETSKRKWWQKALEWVLD